MSRPRKLRTLYLVIIGVVLLGYCALAWYMLIVHGVKE